MTSPAEITLDTVKEAKIVEKMAWNALQRESDPATRRTLARTYEEAGNKREQIEGQAVFQGMGWDEDALDEEASKEAYTRWLKG